MRYQKPFVISLSISGLLAVFILLAYVEIWQPSQLLKDIEWIETAPLETQKKTAHHILKYPIGNYHDAFLILLVHGDIDSVPYLINGLKWIDRFNGDDDFVSCTKDHCLEALRNITGKNPGSMYADWKNLNTQTPGE